MQQPALPPLPAPLDEFLAASTSDELRCATDHIVGNSDHARAAITLKTKYVLDTLIDKIEYFPKGSRAGSFTGLLRSWMFSDADLPSFMNSKFCNDEKNEDFLSKIVDFAIFRLVDKAMTERARSFRLCFVTDHLLNGCPPDEAEEDGNEEQEATTTAHSRKDPLLLRRFFNSPAILKWLFDSLNALVLPTREERDIALSMVVDEDAEGYDEYIMSKDFFGDDDDDVCRLRRAHLSLLRDLFVDNPDSQQVCPLLLSYKNVEMKPLQIYPFVDILYNLFDVCLPDPESIEAAVSILLAIKCMTWNASDETIAAFVNHPRTIEILVHKSICGGIYTKEMEDSGKYQLPQLWDQMPIAQYAWGIIGNCCSKKSGRRLFRGKKNNKEIVSTLVNFGLKHVSSVTNPRAGLAAQAALSLLTCHEKYLPGGDKMVRSTTSNGNDDDDTLVEPCKQIDFLSFVGSSTIPNVLSNRVSNGSKSRARGSEMLRAVNEYLSEETPLKIASLGNPLFYEALKNVHHVKDPLYDQLMSVLEKQIKQYEERRK